MNLKRFSLVAVCLWAATQFASAATIPAGSVLTIRTTQTISSNTRAGATFFARLNRDVTSGRAILVRAGARVNGRVESPANGGSPLVLNLTQLFNNGRWILITTSGPVRQFNPRPSSFRGTPTGPAASFQVPSGTTMQFQLARPMDVGRR